MTEHELPEGAEALLVYFESFVRPDLNKRRVQISGAAVRAWLMRKHRLNFDEAQEVQATIRDSRAGLYHERAA